MSVSANTLTGAKEQISTIYQVSDTAICNLREAPRERAGGGASDDGEASLWVEPPWWRCLRWPGW